MASFVASAGVAVAFLALCVGVVAGGRESGDFDRERVCITSKHAQSKTSRKSSQSSTAGRFYSLGQLRKRANAVSRRRNTSSPIATSVHRLHHGRCNTPVSRHSNRNMRSPKATRDAIPDGSGSIRQSAISGRASSSFTSVGGNTSASRTAPPASWAPQRQA